MSERKSDPPGVRASVVDSGWEPEPQKERELPRYEDAPREALVTRVDDQIQARIAAMNAPDSGHAEEPKAPHDLTVPDAARPGSLPPSDERTIVDQAAPFTSSLPPPHSPTVVDRQPRTLGQALVEGVRVAGGEVPLWAVIAPVLLLTAIVAALVGGALAGPGDVTPSESGAASPGASPSSHADSAGSAPSTSSRSSTRAGPALSDAALQALEKKSARELGSDDALALASGKAARAQLSVHKLAERLAADPGLAKDPAVLTELQHFAAGADTARDALAAMAALPGPLSADLLYEVWTGTAERSDATELAHALLVGRDVRPKASTALAVALDLREAETCEENAKLLARATEVGDKRAFGPLARLLRRTGCGPGKRQDCYPCLREGDALKDALVAVKKRREPELGTH